MPVSEINMRPSSDSLNEVMRPAQPTRRKGKVLPGGDFGVAGLGRRLHDGEEAVIAERELDKLEVARLEHVERECGAWQQDGAAQGKDRQHLRQV